MHARDERCQHVRGALRLTSQQLSRLPSQPHPMTDISADMWRCSHEQCRRAGEGTRIEALTIYKLSSRMFFNRTIFMKEVQDQSSLDIKSRKLNHTCIPADTPTADPSAPPTAPNITSSPYLLSLCVCVCVCVCVCERERDREACV